MGIFRRRQTGERVQTGSTYAKTVLVQGPDALAVERANSMAMATNTFSPMARGVKDNGAAGFTGDRGYGVNRYAGGLWVDGFPVTPQDAYSAVRPGVDPLSQRLGYGSGVAGQPGLPSTGGAAGADQALWLMSMGQANPGFGS